LAIEVTGSTTKSMAFLIKKVMGVNVVRKRQWAGVSLAVLISMVLPGTWQSGNATAQAALDVKILRSNALSQHNVYRAAHRTPALKVDEDLNYTAQLYANYLAAKGKFEHSGAPGIGENLFVYHTTAAGVNEGNLAKHVVKSWYDEVSLYNYETPNFSSQTGHFTQVVWKDSTNVGCGISRGVSNIKGTQYNSFYVVCHYNPAGNVLKNFIANVPKP
jgi:glioma pathogenesis-related protein 2